MGPSVSLRASMCTRLRVVHEQDKQGQRDRIMVVDVAALHLTGRDSLALPG